MSQLNITTIQNLSGGPVTLTKQNAAKAYVAQNGTGTPSAFGSLNLSSITDNATGNYTHNWTNNFANVNYGYVGTGHASAVSWLHSIYTGDPDASNRLTGSTNIQHANTSDVLVDADITNYVAHGDLA